MHKWKWLIVLKYEWNFNMDSFFFRFLFVCCIFQFQLHRSTAKCTSNMTIESSIFFFLTFVMSIINKHTILFILIYAFIVFCMMKTTLMLITTIVTCSFFLFVSRPSQVNLRIIKKTGIPSWLSKWHLHWQTSASHVFRSMHSR